MSNRNTLKQKMKNYLNHPGSLIDDAACDVRSDPDISCTDFSDRLHSGTWSSVLKAVVVLSALHVGERFANAGADQHGHYDGTVAFDRCAAGDFCGDLSRGICQTRQQIHGSDPADNRDAFRNPVHCVRAVRNVVFCQYAGLGIFPAGRCVHFVDHDSSADHASDRRVFEIGSGFLQGGKFRAGSGKTAHRISDRTSVCRTGDLSGRHSGDRADRRRDRGIDVHGGNCGESAVRRDGIRADSRCTYVQSRKRGTLHGSGICDGSGTARPCCGDQYPFGCHCKTLDKSITDRERNR